MKYKNGKIEYIDFVEEPYYVVYICGHILEAKSLKEAKKIINDYQ